MLAVVASFVAVTVIVNGYERTVDGYVEQIRGNAMPSVEYLTAARGELHGLDRYLDTYAESAERGESMPSAPIAEHRARIEAALKRYLALPFFPGEQGMYGYVQDAMREFDRTVRSVVAAAEAHDVARTTAAQRDEQREVERVDSTLQRLVDYDASIAQSLGEDIARTRARATAVAYALDAVCGSLAIAAFVLAMLALRQRMRALEQTGRLAAEHAVLAERRSTELDQFAGRVAHDVLSPLSAVAFALDLSRMRITDEATKALLARGQSSLQRVQRLVTDLLQFARAAAQPQSDASAHIGEVLSDVVEAVRHDAEKARVELVLDEPGDERVACSPGVLTSIVLNLARNAIKHMGDSTVRLVSIGAIPLGDRVRIEVRDTGPGVPDSIAGRIFEPFVRASIAPGVGLGLATVKRLATAHRGEAAYTPGPGGGSIFWVVLPMPLRDPGHTEARADGAAEHDPPLTTH